MFKKRKSRHALLFLFVVVTISVVLFSSLVKGEVVPKKLPMDCRSSANLVIRSTNINQGTNVCVYEPDENDVTRKGDSIRCVRANECKVAAFDLTMYPDLKQGKYWIEPCDDAQGCTFELGGYNEPCPAACIDDETGCETPQCNGDEICNDGTCLSEAVNDQSDTGGAIQSGYVEIDFTPKEWTRENPQISENYFSLVRYSNDDYGNGNYLFYFPKGTQELSTAESYLYGIATGLGDFNGDGHTDWVTHKTYGTAKLTIYKFNSQNSPPTRNGELGYILRSRTGLVRAIDVGDFNGDFRDDIAVISSNLASVYSWSDNTAEDGNFKELIKLSFPSNSLRGVALGDIYRDDNKHELAIYQTMPSKLLVYQNTENSEGESPPVLLWGYEVPPSGSSNNNPINFGDFNGDGHDDLAYSNGARIMIFDVYNKQLIYDENLGYGDIYGMDFGYLDENTAQELVVAARDSLIILFPNKFVKQVDTEHKPYTRVSFFDYDGDGTADIASTSFDNREVIFYYMNQDGNVRDKTKYGEGWVNPVMDVALDLAYVGDCRVSADENACNNAYCQGRFADEDGHRCNYEVEYDCHDWFDNDNDGLIDMQDPDCTDQGGDEIDCSSDVFNILDETEAYDEDAFDGSDACCGDDQSRIEYTAEFYEWETEPCVKDTVCYKEKEFPFGGYKYLLNLSVKPGEVSSQHCIYDAQNESIVWCYNNDITEHTIFGGDLGYLVNADDQGWLCADSDEYMLYDGRDAGDGIISCPSYEYGEGCGLNPTDSFSRWRWEEASKQPFRILTFNNSQQGGTTQSQVYDVISSGKNWVACDPTGELNLEYYMENLQLLNDVGGIVISDDEEGSIDLGEEGSGSGGSGEIIIGDHDIDVDGGQGHELQAESGGEVIQISRLDIMRVPTPISIWGLRGFSGTIPEEGIKIQDDRVTLYEHSDEIEISEGGFGEVSITLDPINSESEYLDIIIKYINQGIEYERVFENAIRVFEEGVSIDQKKANRFICYDEGGRSSIAECAGYSLDSAENSKFDAQDNPYPKTFRAGESLHSLYNFYQDDIFSSNSYLLTFQNKRSEGDDAWNYFLPKRKSDPPLRIRDWKSYDALEFDAYFTTTNKIRLAIYQKPALAEASDDWSEFSGITSQENQDYILFDDYIQNYSIDGNELYKWHRIVIPFDEHSGLRSHVGLLKFYFDWNEVELDIQSKWDIDEPIKSPSIASANNGDQNVAVMTMFDRLHLKRDSDTNTVCAARTWINGFDDYSACQENLPMGWVLDTSDPSGGYCCGDRSPEDPPDYFQGEQGGRSACWNDITMGQGATFSNVKLKLNDDYYNFTCTGSNPFGQEDTCIFPVPAQLMGENEITLLNPYPEVYSANWGHAQSQEFATIDGSTTSELDKMIIVQLKRREVISADGQFWGCWPSQLNNIHIDDANEFEQACIVKAGHFCSPNSGWVPFAGSKTELYPKSAPPGVNLVPNGGFEE